MLIHLILLSEIILSSMYITALDTKELVVIILSQKEGYHAAHADILQRSIEEQASIMEVEVPKIVLTHQLNVKGSWIVIPLFTYLSDNYSNAKWYFFCLENTVVKLNKLLNVFSQFNSSQELWIGHALYDVEPTIIHHFAEHKKKFKYPHIATGFAMTSKLLNRIAEEISLEFNLSNDFSIDASYELGGFILKSKKPVKLTHVPQLCVVSTSDCATYPRFFHPCDTTISLQNAYFAIKTCAKYHAERIPIIKKTWAKYALNIGYFSDQADKNLPEAYIVTNTTKGHCAKTYDILKEVANILKSKNLDWLIICDDDTIFSVARLMRLLTCYYPKNQIAIGERYGYRVWDSSFGYDYLTGGAGIALSAPLVYQMIDSDVCKCPSSNTPDDMFLFGICLRRLNIELTHSSLFHQARPADYATAYLASQEPVSFHKFWMIDPIKVYNQWFSEADSSLSVPRIHTELTIIRDLQIDQCKKSARNLKPVIDRLIEEITNRSTCTVFVTDRTYHGLINNNKKIFDIFKYNILLHDNEEFSPARQRIQKILAHSKTARCNGYIILVANGFLVSEFLQYVERKELINTHGFFLLLHDYRILTSDLNYIWNRIINVVFVRRYKPYKYRSGDTSARPIINLETVYFPNQKQKFVVTKYLDTWYDGKFRYGKNHFVQKISDLKGKTLRVSVFEHIPGVTKESQNFYKGGPSYSAKGLGVEFEVCIRSVSTILCIFYIDFFLYIFLSLQLIRVISQFMNFKAHYYMPYNIENDRWGALEKNETYTGLIGEALARKATFYIGDLYYTSYLLKFFELSIPYNTECLTFLTPESLTDNSWKLLILPFKLYTWIAVLFTLLLAGGIFHLFSLSYQKHIIIYKDVKRKLININESDKIKELRIKQAKKGLYLFTEAQNSMLYTYSMLLLVSLPRLPNPWALRVLIGWWWIYSILVVVIYRASMTASLANPVATITIDTLNQLAKSSISVGGWSEESKEFFLQSLDSDSQEIGNKFQLIKNEKESIEKVANGSFGYYENEFSLRFAHITKYVLEKEQQENNTQNNKTSDVKHNLHIMKDCIINMPIALGMDKNSPLKPCVDLWIRRTIEVGLVNKWLSDVIYPLRLTERQQEKVSEKALVNLHKLYGALVALTIGYFFSLIVLLWEILHWKYIILNNPKYDKYHLDKFYAKI
ncbi:uncharacterized protein LOC118447232 [Vespa mandarinia]|uniref:uncharacterized protein LOC118447232 n=1 Tax=Vespa mandarinia TaxID=7446 RepID=UPI00160EE224|nr:uncharacterized protein LOC118447232 [Vespa mandarinia]